ncbi:disease resistance protein RPS6 isoform X2 [Pyrus x bretschneideri]|uniref:disease resistance protein RPS6 isoform X2 n=1 Tax=Pyrus x bretschneideri TaxID=225117 RepID=UPI00202F6A49|nr:disease resistance protein RPS6 isoform X2 [Pyrus x bretschneideri]
MARDTETERETRRERERDGERETATTMECFMTLLHMCFSLFKFSSPSSAGAGASAADDVGGAAADDNGAGASAADDVGGAAADDNGADNPPLRGKYDVFISFRGEDTRFNITSHLHAALVQRKIETYIDYNLQRGEEIGPALLGAIEKSTLSVIIFSQNYASSTWCLEELVHILKCKKNSGQIVIPIFYDINPSDIRQQRGSYARAFAQLKKRFYDSIDKVQKWRDALTTAANLAGFDYSEKSRTEAEADLIKKVVDDIWTRLKCESSCNLEGLVGIESRIEQIESLLDIHLQDACITVGIWGMGGIGKTTLAETVFHRLSSKFEARCFLRNVRENLEQPNGLDHLEKTLLKEILKEEGLSIGLTFVRERLIRTKVLIVLDDVSDSMQMGRLAANRLQFGTGSRIIITSRDRRTFRQTVEEDKIYEVEGLKPDDALHLFRSHAFKNNNTPTIDFKELPEKVVDYAGGIPLAIITLGSLFVNCKSKAEWEDELNKLKQFPDENIQRVLRLSYDRLGKNDKEIFLDVACFHKGKHVEYVKKMLNIRGFCAAAGIRALIDASLISIDSTWVEMHDLIQDMGRTIVYEQCKDPCKRNRLFNDEDVYHVLESNRGTRHVQAILIKCWQTEKRPLKRADFKVMFNLEMLIVYSEPLGNYSTLTTSLDLPNSLRYLYWYRYPWESLPSNFTPENLVELHMPYSRVNQRLVNLEVINLQYSRNLTEVPNLFGSPKIGHINLHGCESLVEIPSYFQHLDKLTYLDLGRCTSCPISLPNSLRYLHWDQYPLKSLPSKFSPENLVELHMPNSRVKHLWKEDKRLVNLKVINLQCSSNLIEVPNLSRSKKIGHINLHGCKSLVEIPSYFQHLDKLTYLDLGSCTSLISLTNICKLKSLKFLNLSWCSKLESFPEIAVPIKHLESPILNKTAIQELHSSIKFLPALERIDLRGCRRLLSIPKSICELKSLVSLDLKWCSMFYRFPQILEPMEHLQSLNLETTAVEKLPSSIGNLIGLHTLDLGMCKNLKVVSRSIYKLTNLKNLSFYACRKLKKLPSNSVGLPSLELLNLSRSGLLGIPDGLVCTTSLYSLDLSRSMIRNLPASIKQASPLSTLRLIGCKWLQSLPELPLVDSLKAHGGTSLKTVSSSRTTHYTQGGDKYQYFGGGLDFSNCRNLDDNARSNIMDYAQLRIMQVLIASSKLREEEEEEENDDEEHYDDHEYYSYWRPSVSVVCPGKEIPGWFSYQNEESSVKIKLRQDWFRTGLLGFALAVVVSWKLNCQLNRMVIRARFNAKFMGESHEMFTSQFHISLVDWKLNDYRYDQHHVYLWDMTFISEEVAKKCYPDVCKHANEASVEFCLVVGDSSEPTSYMKVEKCGICPLYAEDAERFKFDHVIIRGVPEAKRVIVSGEPEEEEEIRHDDFEASDPKDSGSSDESEEEASGSGIDNSADLLVHQSYRETSLMDLKPMRVKSLKPMLFKSLKSTWNEVHRPYYYCPRHSVEYEGEEEEERRAREFHEGNFTWKWIK